MPDSLWSAVPTAPGRFRLLEHTADLRLALEAPDPAGLYRTAVQALAATMAAETHLAPVEDTPHSVDLSGTDPADLLVCLCNECLYLWEVHAAVAMDLQVDRATATELTGSLLLGTTDDPGVILAVKAATYSELRWERSPAGITAEITLDL